MTTHTNRHTHNYMLTRNREKEEWKEAKSFQRSIEEIMEEAAG